MIHRTSKKSEWLMRKDPHLPMKKDNARRYIKEHNKRQALINEIEKLKKKVFQMSKKNNK